MSGTAINKNDARYLATQELLESTFLELVRTEGFQKITVKRIVSEANLNRGTFYIHALDKYDLLDQIEDRIHKKMMLGVGDLESAQTAFDFTKLRERMMRTVNCVKENQDMIIMLMSDDCDPLFFEKYARKIKTVLFPDITCLNVENQYVIALMGSIIGGLFGEWIERGMKESPEEYVDIVMKIIAKTTLPSLLREL